ncbi:MAG: hypothetical protein ABIU54_13585 [Candidatus Eisenbacteria bacterium]
MTHPRSGRPRAGGPHAGGARRSPTRPSPDRAPSGDYLRHLVEMGRDPSRWESLDPDALSLIAFQQALYYGANHDPEAGASLGALYAYLVERVTVQERLELLERIGEAVQSEATSVLSMLPFLQRETDPQVAQMAAVSFASLMPLTDDDRLTGPRTLRSLFEHSDEEAVRVGLLAGLLALGDRAVQPLLAGTWGALSPEGQVALVRAPQPFVSVLLVEFLVSALEESAAGIASEIASRLVALASEGEGRVLDLERKFPENAPDERPEIALLGEWSASEFGTRMAARLLERAARTDAPVDLDAAMRAWSIPRTGS